VSSLYLTDTLKRIHIATLRELFAADSDFPYNKNDISASSLVINTKFTNPTNVENKMPQIILSVVTYNSGHDTLANDFYKEVPPKVASGVLTTRQFTKVVNYQLQIDVLSTRKAECEFLVDKVFNIFNHEWADLWSALQLNVRGVSVNEVGPKEQYPQYSFVGPIIIQGDFRLVWTMGVPINEDNPKDNRANILRNIKYAVDIATDI